MKTEWVCKGCRAKCTLPGDIGFEPRQCVYSNEMEPSWWKERQLTTIEKMEKVMKLLPGYRWLISVTMDRDEGGEPVSKVAAGLGLWGNEDGMLPIVVDKEGKFYAFEDALDKIPDDCFEVFQWALDTDPYMIIDELCDEVIKRRGE